MKTSLRILEGGRRSDRLLLVRVPDRVAARLPRSSKEREELVRLALEEFLGPESEPSHLKMLPARA